MEFKISPSSFLVKLVTSSDSLRIEYSKFIFLLILMALARRSSAKQARRLAGLTRLELATFRVTGGRSNQTELQPQKLGPWVILDKWMFNNAKGKKNGSSGRTRTCDPTINSRLLYQLSYRGIMSNF